MLADFFSNSHPDTSIGGLPELSAPIVLDLSGEWGREGLKGAICGRSAD
jgi:hypothetical protein